MTSGFMLTPLAIGCLVQQRHWTEKLYMMGEPFTFDVWETIGLSLLVSAAGYWLIERRTDENFNHRRKGLRGFFFNFGVACYMAYNCIGSGACFSPTTAIGRGYMMVPISLAALLQLWFCFPSLETGRSMP